MLTSRVERLPASLQSTRGIRKPVSQPGLRITRSCSMKCAVGEPDDQSALNDQGGSTMSDVAGIDVAARKPRRITPC